MMRASYLLSLTKRDAKGNAVVNSGNVASVQPVAIPPVTQSPEYSDAYDSSPETFAEADEAQRIAVGGNATHPSAFKARPLQLTRPRRVPDYDMMRFMTAFEMVEELRNPSITIAEPLIFAAPRPRRPVKVDRANISAIVDQDWELREGRVSLISTKQKTVPLRVYRQMDGFASRAPLLLQSCDTEPMGFGRVFEKSALFGGEYLRTGQDNIISQLTSYESASEGSDVSFETACSLGHDAGLLDTPPSAYNSSVIDQEYDVSVVDPLALKTSDGPLRKCDWIDCPFCPASVDNRSAEALPPQYESPVTKDSASLTASHKEGKARSRRRTRLRRQNGSHGATKTKGASVHIPQYEESDERNSRASLSSTNASTAQRPCDWIDCSICEQDGCASTAGRGAAAGQGSSANAAERAATKPGGRKEGRKGFLGVAIMLGLIRRP
ncbi:uncharacterized protein C8Q71DRAFT_495579 [Rhodofomes roseus]|uniref:Uncharacterized protein n=1 Tax=Rhodofomes roseus TaxID=34475 RepID=A0ABQ8KMV9_9APHY|nr:uncharacterized protein C8Q71DRAFT_495579 [Rhodofomes roseus]KAH9839092.1 hypothetical protein C8Q71DRAFT_495579 [Rhodofomes roseus]